MNARALYIAFDVYPRPKGSSSHIASMVTALAAGFGPVTVLCLGDADLPVREQSGAIEILRLPATARDMLERATAFAAFVAHHAARLASALQLIVFRDPWGGVPALRTLPHCPAIFEVNALPSWELAYSRPGFAESPALQAKIGDMERFCLRRARAILCVSAVTGRALIAEGVPPGRITIIPNAANPAFFNGALLPCPIPELESGEWCGYIGGLHPWQGVEMLIDAIGLGERGKFIIIHSGSNGLREVERRIARLGLRRRVILQPALTREELAAVFARLAFTVAPLAETARNTWQGCCPVKIVESMAAGTPVIASNLEVSRELIRDGEDGLLVPPEDRRAWARTMETCFANRSLRSCLAGGARRTAEVRFAQPVVHQQLLPVFAQAARD